MKRVNNEILQIIERFFNLIVIALVSVKQMTVQFDVIIVGQGVAGLTCASELAASGLEIGIFEAEFFGGLIVNVNELDNFKEGQGLSGMEHAGMLANENRKAGIKSNTATVTKIQPTEQAFRVHTDTKVYTATFVVVASGAQLKSLGIPGESEFRGRGVSDCADCDAPLFSDSDVVVAGGGNWALKDALLLAQDCRTVHLVYESNEPQACVDYVQQLKTVSNIQCHSGMRITAVLGDDSGMTGVKLSADDGGTEDIIAHGLFVKVGLEANDSMVPDDVGRDATGNLIVDDQLETSMSGLWAIGQVRAGFSGWLNDAAADARHVAQQIKNRSI